MTTTATVGSIVDLTTVPQQHADLVDAMLRGWHGDILRGLAQQAAERAWAGGYLDNGSTMLVDIILRAQRQGLTIAVPSIP